LPRPSASDRKRAHGSVPWALFVYSVTGFFFRGRVGFFGAAGGASSIVPFFTGSGAAGLAVSLPAPFCAGALPRGFRAGAALAFAGLEATGTGSAGAAAWGGLPAPRGLRALAPFTAAAGSSGGATGWADVASGAGALFFAGRRGLFRLGASAAASWAGGAATASTATGVSAGFLVPACFLPRAGAAVCSGAGAGASAGASAGVSAFFLRVREGLGRGRAAASSGAVAAWG
jgi:hypothetical protein